MAEKEGLEEHVAGCEADFWNSVSKFQIDYQKKEAFLIVTQGCWWRYREYGGT